MAKEIDSTWYLVADADADNNRTCLNQCDSWECMRMTKAIKKYKTNATETAEERERAERVWKKPTEMENSKNTLNCRCNSIKHHFSLRNGWKLCSIYSMEKFVLLLSLWLFVRSFIHR